MQRNEAAICLLNQKEGKKKNRFKVDFERKFNSTRLAFKSRKSHDNCLQRKATKLEVRHPLQQKNGCAALVKPLQSPRSLTREPFRLSSICRGLVTPLCCARNPKARALVQPRDRPVPLAIRRGGDRAICVIWLGLVVSGNRPGGKMLVFGEVACWIQNTIVVAT